MFISLSFETAISTTFSKLDTVYCCSSLIFWHILGAREFARTPGCQAHLWGWRVLYFLTKLGHRDSLVLEP